MLLSSNHGSELQTVEDASPRAARKGDTEAPAAQQSSRRGSEFGMAAISPWSEPDEVTALGANVESVPLPDRLGVLPSPAVDSFSVIQESPFKSTQGEVKDVPTTPTKLQSMGKTMGNSVIASEQDPRAEDTKPAPVAPIPEDTSKAVLADEEDDELYDATPIKGGGALGDTTPTANKPQNNIELPSRADFPQAINAEQAVAGSEIQDKDSAETDGRGYGLSTPEATAPAADVPLTSEKGIVIGDAESVQRHSTDLLAIPAISGPSDAHEWDRRSVISSNNEFQDAKEQAVEDDKQSSRRSSVSSLGQAHDMDSQQPVMSSLAVPAGPIPDPSTLQPISNFMNRPYQFGDAHDGRSKSYISLGQDSSGAPLQETLDIASKPKHDSVDLSSFSGPPPGAANFQRQPAVRDVSGEHRPKRYSGVVKGRRTTLTSPDSPIAKPPMSAPAASAISDHFGLEGLQDDYGNFMVGEDPPPRVPDKQEDKKAKRRSGVFDVFKRSPSVSKTELNPEHSLQHRDSQHEPMPSLPAGPPAQTRTTAPPSSISKPPQRASTTITAPEQKKKRFSGLGSIFGRSSKTVHESDKPKKLVKQYIPGREVSQRQATEPVPNYEASEAVRQQQRMEQQRRQPNTYPLPSIGPPPQQYSLPDGNMFKSPEDIRPPPGGWYGPGMQQNEEQVMSHQDPPQHGASQREIQQESPYRHIPETLKSGETHSYRPVGSLVGPPEAGMYSPPTSPVSPGLQTRRISYGMQGRYDQRPPYGQPLDHLSRYTSNESEVSGQSEWERSQWRRQGSSPSISPVQTRPEYDGFPPGRNFRVGSITEEMSRDPAKQYSDQQTPWAISLPRQGEQDPRLLARVPSHGMEGVQNPPPAPVDYAPGGIGYAEAYPPPNKWPQQRGLPISPESPGSSRPMQHFDPVMAHAPVLEDRPRRDIAGSQGHGYPSPPISPESQWFYNRAGLSPPSQMQYYTRFQDPEARPAPRNRFYSQQRAFSYENDSLPAQPRMMSGYSGRRDDPTVSEDSVEMRGVSYPGQEWTPERWEY